MRRVFWGLVACCLSLIVRHASAADVATSPRQLVIQDGLVVQNLATPFVEFWDNTTHLAPADRLTAFKRDVAAIFPAFYGVDRFEGKVTQAQRDAHILNAIEKFGSIRAAYIKKVAEFEGQLRENLESFRRVFPDFSPSAQAYLLHSLGEMDGGTRELDGKNLLIFGVDMMVKTLASPNNASAFFHHEMFHVLHEPFLGQCEELWCSLWAEGLAVHVAKTLNPNANDSELLLSYPAGLVANTEAKRREALIDLKASMTSTDNKIYAKLFQGGGIESGLPTRRGYVMGLWVAQELGKTHTLQQLSRLSAEQAKPLVMAAADALLAQATP